MHSDSMIHYAGQVTVMRYIEANKLPTWSSICQVSVIWKPMNCWEMTRMAAIMERIDKNEIKRSLRYWINAIQKMTAL